MTKSLVLRVGGILSADIAVPEHEREVRSYSHVLSTGANPLWRENLMNNLGMPIIGLGARSTELEALALQWMPHIQVADVAAFGVIPVPSEDEIPRRLPGAGAGVKRDDLRLDLHERVQE